MVEGAGPGAQQVFTRIPRFTVSLNSSCFFYKTELVVIALNSQGCFGNYARAPACRAAAGTGC